VIDTNQETIVLHTLCPNKDDITSTDSPDDQVKHTTHDFPVTHAGARRPVRFRIETISIDLRVSVDLTPELEQARHARAHVFVRLFGSTRCSVDDVRDELESLRQFDKPVIAVFWHKIIVNNETESLTMEQMENIAREFGVYACLEFGQDKPPGQGPQSDALRRTVIEAPLMLLNSIDNTTHGIASYNESEESVKLESVLIDLMR
jgi:hypothetical protein